MIGWLLRIFGIGGGSPKRRSTRGGSSNGSGAGKSGGSGAQTPRHETMASDVFKASRRRVVMYIARARVPIRQAAMARHVWIQDLGKVYEAIKSSPTELILERAGEVGARHEESFRDALSHAQSIEPPPEADEVHQELVNWLTCLHSACLALMDARRLKDRSMLGTFRERLGQGRRHAASLAALRNAMFVDYKLRIDPTIKQKRAAAAGEAPAEAEAEAPKQAPAPRPVTRGGRRVRGRPLRTRAAAPGRPPAPTPIRQRRAAG